MNPNPPPRTKWVVVHESPLARVPRRDVCVVGPFRSKDAANKWVEAAENKPIRWSRIVNVVQIEAP